MRTQNSNVSSKARQAYLSTLRTEHASALKAVTAAVTQANEIQTTVTANAARVRQIASELRAMGENVQDADLPRVPRGTAAAAPRAARTGTTRQGIRHSNSQNLGEAITSFMGSSRIGTEFSIPEIAAGVVAAGYRTTTKTFNVIISQRLNDLIEAGTCARPSRGSYTLLSRSATSTARTPRATSAGARAAAPARRTAKKVARRARRRAAKAAATVAPATATA